MIVYAVNIHTGGGKVLLDALLLDQPFGAITKVYADQRYVAPENIQNTIEIVFIKPKLFHRLFAEIKMYLDKNYFQAQDVLFFGNLPPLFRLLFSRNKNKNFILYLQNAFLIMNFNYPKNSAKEYLRLFLEKVWLHMFSFQVDEIWVQTLWMKQKTAQALNFKKPIKAKPFLPKLPQIQWPDVRKYKFLYVGSMAKHKGLDIFLNALKNLNLRTDKKIKVCIILDSAINNIKFLENLNLNNIEIDTLTSIARMDLFKIYADSEFLVCTSSLESFYLPIYEAHHFGCQLILPSDISYSMNLPEDFKTKMYKPYELDLTLF